MDMQNIIISCLVCGAVLCSFWTIRNLLPSSTENSNSDRLPALFKIFGAGIFFFAAEAGSIMAGMFPNRSKKIEEIIKGSKVENKVLEVLRSE